MTHHDSLIASLIKEYIPPAKISFRDETGYECSYVTYIYLWLHETPRKEPYCTDFTDEEVSQYLRELEEAVRAREAHYGVRPVVVRWDGISTSTSRTIS